MICTNAGGVRVLGQSRLWGLREAHSDAIKGLGPPVKLDVTVPLPAVEVLVDGVRDIVRKAGSDDCRLFIFGHLNEGNLHINLVGPRADSHELAESIFSLVASLRGSVCSEHGVERVKVPWIGYSRSKEDLEVIRKIKRALDPHGILNPGVVLGEDASL